MEALRKAHENIVNVEWLGLLNEIETERVTWLLVVRRLVIVNRLVFGVIDVLDRAFSVQGFRIWGLSVIRNCVISVIIYSVLGLR